MVRRFVIVGALGFIVQLTVLGLLTYSGWSWLAATVTAVECAVVHNFVWHRWWTWRHRLPSGTRTSWPLDFLKFNAGTAFTSVAGNVGVMAIVFRTVRVDPLLANIIAVGVMSAANFLLADRWVFRRTAPRARGRERVRLLTQTFAAAAVVILAGPRDAFAGPGPAALAAWEKYVTETEAELGRSALQPVGRSAAIRADGGSVDVGSGTITHWCGAMFIPSVTVDGLLERLKNPGTPPPQDDVVTSRVTARGEDSLSVYIRLMRRAIVTVSYDTDHQMTFRRWSPTLATARSIATRIEELGGDDHGFLWRLNSYWRYEQEGDGVVVSLHSLTLSRDVPWIVKPIAGPIASRIARESMIRTLEALRRYVTKSLD